VAENCDRPDLHEIAVRHSETTLMHQFREDGSTCHVVVYDPETGEELAKHTHQGWKDESM
jgi:unsaturated chondroitin disaccharide hydrolase